LLVAALLSFYACANTSRPIPGTIVEIVEFKFTPEVQTVVRGTTVSWVNRDPYFHTVTSGKTDGPVNEPDGVFDRNLKERGYVVKVSFDEPGTFTYFCKQHNAMNGEIRVS
jgi:plastocyanin